MPKWAGSISDRSFIEFVKNGNAEDEEVEYAEDCFDDVERPKFGYSLKITLKDAEPCEFNLENPELSTCGLNRTNSENSNNSAQSRQTGQEFRSGAPPDCRIEFCGLNTIGMAISKFQISPLDADHLKVS